MTQEEEIAQIAQGLKATVETMASCGNNAACAGAVEAITAMANRLSELAVEVPPDTTEAPTHTAVPYVEQLGGLLTCTMGEWTGEPTSYAYEWTVDGMIRVDAVTDTCAVTVDDEGKTASCVVTATNATGAGTAPPSNEVVVGPVDAGQRSGDEDEPNHRNGRRSRR